MIREDYEPPTLWTSVVRYGVAVLVVCLAAGLTLLLPPVATGTPFLFFFAAVILSAWYGGLGPALLTILLAAAWSSSCSIGDTRVRQRSARSTPLFVLGSVGA